MERVQSIINRLNQQMLAKASAPDLLATTQLLYSELVKHETSEIIVNVGTVSVWAPKGFGTVVAKHLDWATQGENEDGTFKNIIQSIDNELNIDVVRNKNLSRPMPPSQVETPIASASDLAKPPELGSMQRAIEVVENKPVITTEKAAEVKEFKEAAAETVLQLDVEISQDEMAAVEAFEKKQKLEEELLKRKQAEELHEKMVKMAELATVSNAVALENAMPTPVIDDKLEPPTAQPKPAPKLTKPFPDLPDLDNMVKKVSPIIKQVTPKKEVNELALAEKKLDLNEKHASRTRDVREIIYASSERISDIRKSISINDKYQMINILFREDEDMFERSVRTLNNFGSLAEAKFWMQRELVVKLGWNDEDQLVQTFYKLVSRRFA